MIRFHKPGSWEAPGACHPILDFFTVSLSVLGFIAAFTYLILLFCFPGTALPVL